MKIDIAKKSQKKKKNPVQRKKSRTTNSKPKCHITCNRDKMRL